MNIFNRFALVTAATFSPILAFADSTLDVTGATGALASVGTAVAAIGVAMITAISAGIVYRWVVAFLAK